MSRRIILQIVIGVVIVALVVGGIIFVQAFRTPLAPQMTVVPVVETLPPIPTATLSVEVTPEAPEVLSDTTVTPEAAAQGTTVPEVSPEFAAQAATEIPGICGGAGAMTILLTGKDAGYFQPPYGADAIRLINVDFVAQKITIFSIPRNIVVTTSNLVNYGTSEARIGDAYQVIMDKESQAADVDIKATSALAQIIFENFGVLPEHYITIKSTLVKDIINSIGGIEVDVANPIDSPSLKLDAGVQRLDGQTTQEFLRYREDSTSSEWNRLPRQDQVIKGLIKKILSPAIILRGPDLINQFRYGATTDLSLQQIMNLSCMMGTVPSEEIKFDSVNPNNVTVQDDGSMIMVDKELVKSQLLSVFGPSPAP
jgi:polyisoprenyl-teichoic acid--peptidoglycan teichoic acid transferase